MKNGRRVDSKLADQVAQPYAHGLRDAQQGMQTNPLFAPLDFADINRMEVGLLRQFLLAQAGLDALVADRVAKDLQL